MLKSESQKKNIFKKHAKRIKANKYKQTNRLLQTARLVGPSEQTSTFRKQIDYPCSRDSCMHFTAQVIPEKVQERRSIHNVPSKRRKASDQSADKNV